MTALVLFICRAKTFFESFFESEMDADGEPSALSIVRKWRAQMLEEEERNLQHEKELIAAWQSTPPSDPCARPVALPRTIQSRTVGA